MTEEHRMSLAPRAVYDSDGDRLGYVTTCTCDYGIFVAGDVAAKDECWQLLAGHMVVANPDLANLVKGRPR